MVIEVRFGEVDAVQAWELFFAFIAISFPSWMTDPAVLWAAGSPPLNSHDECTAAETRPCGRQQDFLAQPKRLLLIGQR